MNTIRTLWTDENGALLTTEYIILGTLLALGLIVAISAARDSLVTEFEDYAQAVDSLNLTGSLSDGKGLAGTSEVVFQGQESGNYTVVP